MTRTMLSFVGAALLAGTSAVALAQTDNSNSNPSYGQSTGTRPGANDSNATMRGNASGRMNMSPDRVKEVQNALDQKGQHVAVDGKWGKQTGSALRNFQKENGLRPTGRLDPETAQKLGLPASG